MQCLWMGFSMTESCPSIPERARDNRAVIFQAVARVTQTAVAEAIGVSDSTVSRMLADGSVDKTAHFLAAADLKVVPNDAQMYEASYIKSLQVLAARCLAMESSQ